MFRNKIAIISALLGLLVITGAGVLYYRHVNRFDDVSTTSKSRTAQADYKDGNKRSNSQSNGNSQGGAIDTGGADVSDGDGGIVSQTGAITVKQPAVDGRLVAGSIVGGTSSGIDTVEYRLIDDSVGVLAQGSLTVVDGAFSGSLQFKPKASTGRLDIFSYNAQGMEINNVEIRVRFGE